MSSTVTWARRPAGVQHAEGHVAGAAGDVEMAEGPRSRRVQAGDERVLPGPVQAAGHQVVHEVVAARHGAEDLVHPALLVAERHDLGAEMREVVGLAGHRGQAEAPLLALHSESAGGAAT